MDHKFLMVAVVDPKDNYNRYSIRYHSADIGDTFEYLFKKLGSNNDILFIFISFLEFNLKLEKQVFNINKSN